ncbi:MAG: type II toxin-antitoxin system MqsA family antitoxin [Campylobacterota bacterium]|nr:type II toxin-antitoxin system MqsA family antitoxin [Campylobacterota bacterium]
MKCMICKHGDTRQGTTTITLEKNDSTIVFREVPAMVCDNCGEAYVEAEITRELLYQAAEIIKSGAKVDIRNYQLNAA